MSSYSACGKFILTGEHFILYGTPAIALPWLSASLQLLPKEGSSSEHPHHVEIFPAIQQAWQAARKRFALPTTDNFPFEIRSEIPQGSGFGSSAALCLTLLEAAAQEAQQDLTIAQKIKAATELESLFHGRSSGLDPAVVANRCPLRFTMDGGWSPFAWRLQGCGFVLAVSPQSRQTAEAVAKVKRYADAHPKAFQVILDDMHQLLQDLESTITQPKGDETQAAQEMGERLTFNHQLLQQVGISTPALDRLVEVACQNGAWGAKLTGAGLGGAMFAFAPLDKLNDVAEALQNEDIKHCAIYHPNPPKQ